MRTRDANRQSDEDDDDENDDVDDDDDDIGFEITRDTCAGKP